LAKTLIGIGLRPNHVSLLSMAFSALAAGCFLLSPRQTASASAGLLLLAALMIQLRLLCHLVDGLIAVEGGLKTKTGELYNDVPDRISDTITLASVGYALPDWGWGPAMGWMAAIAAMMTAYIRVLGGAVGTTQYFLGPMAKQQRMGLLTGACLLG